MYYSKDIERLGTGLKRIADACEDAGVKYDFVSDNYGFTVVFYRPDLWVNDDSGSNIIDVADKIKVADKVTDKIKVADKVADKVAIKLTHGERAFINALLPYFSEHEWVTNSTACELSGLTEGSVKRFLRRLTDSEVLQAQGERKGRRYRLRSEE